MKTIKFQTEEEWLDARSGKITGSRLSNVIVKRGNGQKEAFYELIAERVAVKEETTESELERGKRLEAEAVARFAKETGKKVDTSLVLWERDDNPDIAISPDGFIGKKEAVEAKCLSSVKHIRAWCEQKIPSEHWEQVLQYFIVNDDLQTLHFVFYDPRVPSKEYFAIQVQRKDVQEEVEKTLAYEREVLAKVNDIVNQLTF